MDGKKERWTFWIWSLVYDNGRGQSKFERAGSTRQTWPVPEFENTAHKSGFHQPHRDCTLIGGYFSRMNGDCLICLPADMPPETVEEYN